MRYPDTARVHQAIFLAFVTEMEQAVGLTPLEAELLAACKAQHRAIDWLFAQLIEASTTDTLFLPSKSRAWAACLQGNAAIANAEGRAEATT